MGQGSFGNHHFGPPGGRVLILRKSDNNKKILEFFLGGVSFMTKIEIPEFFVCVSVCLSVRLRKKVQ